jgi:hypothetical protein
MILRCIRTANGTLSEVFHEEDTGEEIRDAGQ